MNRIREAVLAKMVKAGLEFVPGTVRVVAFELETGIYLEAHHDLTDVVLAIDLTYETPAGTRAASTVRIPVEGWSESWLQIQRGIIDTVNGDDIATTETTPTTLDLTDRITVL